MKTNFAGEPERKGPLALALAGCLLCTPAFADTESCLHPAWWDTRSVITTHTNEFINDRAPVNQGQVKWFALQAYEEFNEKLPGAGNAGIRQRIDGFTDQNNYLPVNLGQLKHVAAPCYDRLAAYGLAGSYPWEGDPELANDYAIATVGQLKEVFSFDLPTGSNFYYVATSGSDENPGTFDQPFQTIQHAVNQVIPGDTVLIRGGTYREQVTLTVSGTAEQPITIRGYGDEYPTLKGSDIVTSWVHYQDNIWMVTNWTINSQQVFDDGVPLQQIGYPSDSYVWQRDHTYAPNGLVGLGLDDVMPGSFFWNETGKRLYAWLIDGSDPTHSLMELSTRTFCLHANECSYYILRGIHFRHSNTVADSPQGYPAVIIGPNSMIEDCDIQWCDFGGLMMQLNTRAVRCNISNNGNNGIMGSSGAAVHISGCTITNNNYRRFWPGWHAGGMKLIPDASGIVEKSEVAWNNGLGIWFDTCNSGNKIVIRNNYIHHNNHAGIEIEQSSNADIYNNLLLNNKEGMCIAASANVNFFNNTIAETFGYFALELRSVAGRPDTLSGNRCFNNLLYNNSSTYEVKISTPNSFIYDNYLDFNCFSVEEGLQRFSQSGTVAYSMEEWRLLSGQDEHSQQSHPLILNPTLNNYNLSIASPCINAGTNLARLSTIPYDLADQPRIANGVVDIGAYEFNGFENQTRPSIWMTTPTLLLPYDQNNLTGTMNANISGALSALIISDGTTNRVPVSSLSIYNWELDTGFFEVDQEYTVTIYGTNTMGSLAQQTISVISGNIGTGTPSLSITNPAPIILESGVAQLGGTNNFHITGQMWWSNQYNRTYVAGGLLTAANGAWNLNVDELYPGLNEIHVFGTNDCGVAASDTVLVDYGNTTNHYVAVDSQAPTYPFITWDTAAQTIQEAVDASANGDTVYVTNGIYQTGTVEHEYGRTRVYIDKGIVLKSMNGPEETIIEGHPDGAWWPPYMRCVLIDHTNACLIGFTLTKGHAANNYPEYLGGGALIVDMNLMSNCIITACSSIGRGGGVCVGVDSSDKGNGILTDCLITMNSARYDGGGLMILSAANLSVENSIFQSNTTERRGGGMYIYGCRQVRNCLIINNSAGLSGGGATLGNNSAVYNSTIENNEAPKGGGVVVYAGWADASIYNSILYHNDADNYYVEKSAASPSYNLEDCLTAPLPTNAISTAGSITNEPLYLYPYRGDYRLASNSPGINMGATFDWMSDSRALNYTNRILFGQPDMGCYEFDGSLDVMMPMVEISSPSGWFPYDEPIYIAHGGKNINTTELQATLTTNGITNNLVITLSGNYDWNISPFTLQPEITNTLTVIGKNDLGNISDQTISLIRGGIGTGAPKLTITNQWGTIFTETDCVISGTNNIHVTGQCFWGLYDDGYDILTQDSFPVTGLVWQVAFTNLESGIYYYYVTGTNSLDIGTFEYTRFEVR